MIECRTTLEEARELREIIDNTVTELRDLGYDNRQIGAALTGIGIAISSRHGSMADALANLDAVRDALLQQHYPKQ